LRCIVRLLDAGGDGTVKVEIHATGTRLTVMADSTYIDLVAKGKAGTGIHEGTEGQAAKTHS
jgi:hypothetical protein